MAASSKNNRNIVDKKYFCYYVPKRGFRKFNLVVYQVPGDGDCFFHSLLLAFFIPYRTLKFKDGSVADRSKIVRDFRHDLAKALSQKVKGRDKILYDCLSRGELGKYSKIVPQYSMKNMKRMLKGYSFVGQEVLELTSELCNKDVYIIDNDTKDVYNTGDIELLYKDRPSIVILYVAGNHYDLIGVKEGNDIITHFSISHPFIKFLRTRLYLL